MELLGPLRSAQADDQFFYQSAFDVAFEGGMGLDPVDDEDAVERLLRTLPGLSSNLRDARL